MAKLVTVVRTYFQSGNYRNSTIEIEIPDEAAELIKEYWEYWGVCFNCVKAKFLASNQAGICLIYKGGEEIAGIQGMPQEDTQREEVFERRFKDEEEDDGDLTKQQATNALERIKSALRADNQDKAVELVQQIFKAGFQHGVDSIFEGGPEDE